MALLIRVVTLISVVLFLPSCGRKSAASIPSGVLARIQKQTGLVFPNQSIVVNWEEGGQLVDPGWAAKVLIPVSSLNALSQQLASKPAAPFQLSPAYASSVSWWTVSNPTLKTVYEADPNTVVLIELTTEDSGVAAYVECATH